MVVIRNYGSYFEVEGCDYFYLCNCLEGKEPFDMDILSAHEWILFG